LENQDSVDQKTARVRQRVGELIAACPDVLADQGSVVEGWRDYQGRRLGPYYRLTYRIDGRQQSIYLGADPQLADEVRRLLEDLKAPRRQRLLLAQQRQMVKRSLADHKMRWQVELAEVGLYLKGNEVRGMRNLMGHYARR